MENEVMRPKVLSFVCHEFDVDSPIAFNFVCRLMKLNNTSFVHLEEGEDRVRKLTKARTLIGKGVKMGQRVFVDDLPEPDLSQVFGGMLLEKVAANLKDSGRYVSPLLRVGHNVVIYGYADWVLFSEEVFGFRPNLMLYTMLNSMLGTRLPDCHEFRPPDYFVYPRITLKRAGKGLLLQNSGEMDKSEVKKFAKCQEAFDKKGAEAGERCRVIEISDEMNMNDIIIEFQNAITGFGFT
jgi:hypothetical protein